MRKDMVTFKASQQANTIVVGATARYNVYTDPDDKEASQLTLERSIADQLVKKGVGEITGDADDEAGEDGNLERLAAERVEDNADADDEFEGTSGATTRDTTAFRTPPLELADTTAEGAEGEDDDDAPPVEGEDAPEGETKPKAPPRKRTTTS